MRANIHVEGRPEWRFIKIHTHGAGTKEDADGILGPELDRALTYMEKTYNDGARYVLHYVTAREAFNLARAAVDGKQGDPRQYYDYLIPPYEAGRGALIALHEIAGPIVGNRSVTGRPLGPAPIGMPRVCRE